MSVAARGAGGHGRSPFASERRLRRRRMRGRAMEALAFAATMLAVVVLGIVVVSVAVKGASAISFDLLFHSERPFGEPGSGIANALVGTVILVALASAIAIPVGILVGLYTSQFAGGRLGSVVRFALDILGGVPTIVTGIFIFALIVYGKAQSGWAGAISLAIIMLPIVARSAHEVLALVPGDLREASLALGVARWRTALRVIVPTAGGGLITGSLLAVARVSGETAPLLFTSSIFATTVGTNPSSALASIPVRIFQLSETPSPAEHAQAWAAALLLIVIVLLVNVLARALFSRSSKRTRSGGWGQQVALATRLPPAQAPGDRRQTSSEGEDDGNGERRP
ncbi:MAG: phosphate ABC transporter permease PstA [Solirubrobacteraceae bacterium]